MPTGYTADVADGKVTTLRDYALTCARAFGALITMRDEPFSAPIPDELAPSTKYHDEQLTRLRAELAELGTMTDAQTAAKQDAEIAEANAYRDKYLADRTARAERYADMASKVRAWSTEAEGIRDFMLEQLARGASCDCGGDYEPPVPEAVAVVEWRAERAKKLAEDIGYHEQKVAEEVARTAERNRWLKALRESLPADEPAVTA